MSAALKRLGYEVTGASRQLLPADLENFDLIVTMDETNLADVRELDASGSLHPKIRPLVSFCRTHKDKRVPDPYYGGEAGFAHVISLLEDACGGILEAFPE